MSGTIRSVRLAESDADIDACFPVVVELRPLLERSAFVARVREQQQTGYELAFVQSEDGVVAIAGFRSVHNLSSGHFLYVDDLVTLASERSRGHGRALLAWLGERARERGMASLQLDSGVQRLDAHRFYEREGMKRTSFHFSIDV